MSQHILWRDLRTSSSRSTAVDEEGGWKEGGEMKNEWGQCVVKRHGEE